jgi:hypothetical protein
MRRVAVALSTTAPNPPVISVLLQDQAPSRVPEDVDTVAGTVTG